MNHSCLKLDIKTVVEFETWAASVLLEKSQHVDIQPLPHSSWHCGWAPASCLGLLHGPAADRNSWEALWTLSPAHPHSALHFFAGLRRTLKAVNDISQVQMRMGMFTCKSGWMNEILIQFVKFKNEGNAAPKCHVYWRLRLKCQESICSLRESLELWLSHCRDCFNVFS